MILVTPALTTLLSSGNDFIPNALGQAFQKLDIGQEIDVLAAVVDRIPYPAGNRLADAGLQVRGVKYGSEGVSILVGNSSAIVPDLWSPRDQTHEPETMSIEQRCSLTFTIQPSASSIVAYCSLPLWNPIVSRSVALPLANTLFQSGKTSTLFAQRWAVTEIQDENPQLLRVRHSNLEQQELQIHYDISQDQGEFQTGHFYHLTPPQIITASMGNIIRRFQVGDDPGENEPASKKLEEAISLQKWSQPGQSPPPLTEVWAQVIPRELWLNHPQLPTVGMKMIEQGHRLHRVLSGGGGWGNKQGLLALDPDSSFHKPKTEFKGVFGDGYDIEAEKREALGEVVRPGDVVRFLVLVERRHLRTKVHSKFTGSQPLMLNGPPSFHVGSIPSTIDEMPLTEDPLPETANFPDYIICKGHFGALSKTGMSIELKTHGPGGATFHGARKVGLVVQTKVPSMTSYEVYRYGSRIVEAIGKQPPGFPILILNRSASRSLSPLSSASVSPLVQLLPSKQSATVVAEKPQEKLIRPLIRKKAYNFPIKQKTPGRESRQEPQLPKPNPQYLKNHRNDSPVMHIHLKLQKPHPDQRAPSENNPSPSSPSPVPDISDDSSEVTSFLREVEAKGEARAVEADKYFGSGDSTTDGEVDEFTAKVHPNDGAGSNK